MCYVQAELLFDRPEQGQLSPRIHQSHLLFKRCLALSQRGLSPDHQQPAW